MPTDRTKATIMVNTELWKRLRVIAILNEFEISELVEEALREKLAKMQQPEQYKQYEDVKDLRYKPKGRQQQQPQSPKDYVTEAMMEGKEHFQPRQSTQPQSEKEQQRQKQMSDMLHNDNVLIPISKDQRAVYLWLPGLRFPKSKTDLMKYAYNTRIGNSKDVLFALENLPGTSDKEYRTKEELEEDLKIASNNIIKKYAKHAERDDKIRVVECIIAIDENEAAAKRYQKEEKARRMKYYDVKATG